MKIREMDIYFTVPVDCATLTACRTEAGYETALHFQKELASRGFPFGYVSVEHNHNPGRRIRGDMAEVIAEVLGMDVEAVFPAYSAAKAAAEAEVDENYYKPFTTATGRNAAIVAAMEPVKWTALKYCRLLKEQNGGHFLEQDDIISIAYETLVHMADRAMHKGIRKGASFEAAACVAVKQEFLRRWKEGQQKSRKADIVSYEALYSHFERCHAAGDFTEYIELRDEAMRAVADLPEEKKQSKRIRALLEELGWLNPNPVFREAVACA